MKLKPAIEATVATLLLATFATLVGLFISEYPDLFLALLVTLFAGAIWAVFYEAYSR